jgi:hypothetical protein
LKDNGDWDDIFATHVINKGIIVTIYEENLIMNKEIATPPQKNGQRIWIRKVAENMFDINMLNTFEK